MKTYYYYYYYLLQLSFHPVAVVPVQEKYELEMNEKICK